MKTVEAQQQEVLEEVGQMIMQVTGSTLDFTGPITMETSFNHDLELESIEFVALAELLQERYGGEVNFVEWLSGMELERILELKVGDLVNHIVACRS